MIIQYIFGTIIFLVFLCPLESHSDTMKTMRGAFRKGGEGQINFSYENSDKTGKILATLSDGEQFEGKYVSGRGNNNFSAQQLGLWGQIEAVLLGNKGHMMRCWFKISSPRDDLDTGGVGYCEVSDGRIIDVYF